jgi:hypothetical protein
LRLPDFKTIGKWRRRLSALFTGHLYSQEIFLVLISVTGWVNPRAIVQPERLCQWKTPVTLLGIEPTTYQLVVHCSLCISKLKLRRMPRIKYTKHNVLWLAWEW